MVQDDFHDDPILKPKPQSDHTMKNTNLKVPLRKVPLTGLSLLAKSNTPSRRRSPCASSTPKRASWPTGISSKPSCAFIVQEKARLTPGSNPPAGDLGPAIPAGDKALETGNFEHRLEGSFRKKWSTACASIQKSHGEKEIRPERSQSRAPVREDTFTRSKGCITR